MCVYICCISLSSISTRDAPIRQWPQHLTIGRLSANCQLTQKLILLSYLSYLFRLRLLSEDSFLLEGLQSAVKTKMHPKATLQNAPTFTNNGSHSHVCLLLVIKLKTCTYQLCKWQSADINVLISRYRLSAKQLIPITCASLKKTPSTEMLFCSQFIMVYVHQ